MSVEASVIKSNLKHFGQFPKVEVVNPDETIWKNHYLVCIDYFSVYYVIADNEQDALDILIDYCEEQGYHGYFMEPADYDQLSEDEKDDVTYAGNHCRALTIDTLIIEQL